MNPWDRLQGESAAAYEAFRQYLEMPSRVAAKVGENSGKPATIEKWSAKWHWAERAAAFDSSLVEARRMELLAFQSEMLAKKMTLARLEMDKSIAGLEELDPAKLGKRALVELAGQAFAHAEALTLSEPPDNELKITIRRAGNGDG